MKSCARNLWNFKSSLLKLIGQLPTKTWPHVLEWYQFGAIVGPIHIKSSKIVWFRQLLWLMMWFCKFCAKNLPAPTSANMRNKPQTSANSRKLKKCTFQNSTSRAELPPDSMNIHRPSTFLYVVVDRTVHNAYLRTIWATAMLSKLDSSKTLLEGMDAIKFGPDQASRKRELDEMIRVTWKALAWDKDNCICRAWYLRQKKIELRPFVANCPINLLWLHHPQTCLVTFLQYVNLARYDSQTKNKIHSHPRQELLPRHHRMGLSVPDCLQGLLQRVVKLWKTCQPGIFVTLCERIPMMPIFLLIHNLVITKGGLPQAQQMKNPKCPLQQPPCQTLNAVKELRQAQPHLRQLWQSLLSLEVQLLRPLNECSKPLSAKALKPNVGSLQHISSFWEPDSMFYQSCGYTICICSQIQLLDPFNWIYKAIFTYQSVSNWLHQTCHCWPKVA